MHFPAHILQVLSGAALGLILVAVPLALGLIPRNRWYGVRTASAMRGSEADWYALNRKGGIVLLSLSFSLLVILAGFALI